MTRGKLFVIEGNDGAGKETQAKLILKRMQKEGIPFEMFDFPQYGQPSARPVERLLNGEFGKNVTPEKASICYAVDRFSVAPKIEKSLASGTNGICNRYTESSKAYWGCKIKDQNKRMKYFAWLDDLEQGVLEIPKPSSTVFLYMPPKIGQRLVDEKKGRTYTKGRDIIESNIEHLEAAIKTYDQLVTLYGWHKIVCGHGDTPRTREDINDELFEIIKRELN